jgi:methylphosphotriester-DNA--protein-cysteine methyltransferase
MSCLRCTYETPRGARGLASEPNARGSFFDLGAKDEHASLLAGASHFVGEPPLTYLTRWRMHLAAQRLRYSTDTVGAIAREVGYTSEYAFNRAFARHRGQPPGRYRRLANAA